VNTYPLGGRLRDASVEQIGPKVWDLAGLGEDTPALEISALEFPKLGAQLKVGHDRVGLLPLECWWSVQLVGTRESRRRYLSRSGIFGLAVYLALIRRRSRRGFTSEFV
jgi:hypothetical protein